MSYVSLNFEDDANGEIAFKATYGERFNPDSPAHRLANQVILFLDQHAERKHDIGYDPVITPLRIPGGR